MYQDQAQWSIQRLCAVDSVTPPPRPQGQVVVVEVVYGDYLLIFSLTKVNEDNIFIVYDYYDIFYGAETAETKGKKALRTLSL